MYFRDDALTSHNTLKKCTSPGEATYCSHQYSATNEKNLAVKWYL